MSNIPIDDNLKKLFDDITQGKSGEDPERAILVQNDSGILRLIESAPAKGSDREDFDDVLGRLFANEPTKPGYALYRLDSKSPAGLFEWINCAFRPEGAKVREKMQYSITQASLFKGLNEQHFLETVYGATSREFSFPSRLRNSRKHDYQNPQLSTKGKSASEAAGTDAGGLRRNFEALSASSNTTANGSNPSQTSNAPTKLVATMPDVATSVQAEPKAVSQVSPSPSSVTQPSAVTASQKAEEPSQPEPLSVVEQKTETKEPEPASEPAVTASQEEPVQEEPTSVLPQTEESDEGVQVLKPTNEASETAQSITAEEPKEPKPDTSSLASETVPTVAATAAVATSSAAAPSTTKEETKSSKPTSDSSQQEKAASASITAPTTQSTSSIGVGKGAGGLETEREKQLAQLKSEESRYKSSASSQQGAGGPHTGFAWNSDVDGALSQLAKSGSSSASANLVVLKLDLSKEEVQLAGEPENVEPSGLSTALSAFDKKEPSYAFYAHPELQTSDDQESQLALIYICPASSTVRQRMLYSVNLAVLSNRVDGFDGIKIVKRTETSDVEDLTPEFLADALSLSSAAGSQQNGGANAFTRPKRPGRR